MKKPGKVEKLGPLRTIPYSEFKKYLARHEVALVSHRDGSNLSSPSYFKSEDIDGPTFYRLVSQEMRSLKDPGRLAAVAAMQSKEKSKLVDHAM